MSSEECERCSGSGCDVTMCEECGEEFQEPCARHRGFGHRPSFDTYDDGSDCCGCCTACHPTPSDGEGTDK